MAVRKTSLSVGEIVREILTEDTDVMARCRKVFPVATDEAKLPYILYRRTSLEELPTKQAPAAKQGGTGADTVALEVLCFTAGYGEGVELAEAVRAALDGVTAEGSNGLRMRSCILGDSEEAWQDDAYVQQLVFNIKV